jgi:hypothetical protein
VLEGVIVQTFPADTHGNIASAAKQKILGDLETAASAEFFIEAEQAA